MTFARMLAAAGALLIAAARPLAGPPAEPEPRSLAVYPAQEIALRVSHAQHLRKGVRCAQCHGQISRSDAASDRNIPAESRCATCHEIEEAKAGKKVDPPSACADCHPGFDWSVQRAPAPSRFPTPNLIFSHARHLDRGAQCTECHGDMIHVELATRAQLPKMADCLVCHDGRRAPAACGTCHLPAVNAKGGLLETHLASGTLRPGAGNPFGLDHGPRFEREHARLAARQREQCMACHAQSSCDGCHGGAMRRVEVHPAGFISTHMVPARQSDQRCDACHRRQSFCAACHERTGVGRNASNFDSTRVSVHPPGWLTPGPDHHGIQAARNVGSCASCHREEQCIGCHAAGAGNPTPHPPGFASRCREMMRKNDRACVKCHDLSSASDAAARCR